MDRLIQYNAASSTVKENHFSMTIGKTDGKELTTARTSGAKEKDRKKYVASPEKIHVIIELRLSVAIFKGNSPCNVP